MYNTAEIAKSMHFFKGSSFLMFDQKERVQMFFNQNIHMSLSEFHHFKLKGGQYLSHDTSGDRKEKAAKNNITQTTLLHTLHAIPD